MKTAPFGTKGEPMSKHTSLKIGGPAQFYLRVVSERDVMTDWSRCAEETNVTLG